MRIDNNGIADLYLQLNWESGDARHTDCYAAKAVNLWRDILPQPLRRALQDKRPGDRVQVDLTNGHSLGERQDRNLMALSPNQFQPRSRGETARVPRLGRFYPKGLLRDVPGVFRANKTPFRLVGIQERRLEVDFNHPLAGKEVSLSATVGQVQPKDSERGGTSHDWLEVLASGPGMQARANGSATDFFSDDPFFRADGAPDTAFYRSPRLVQHLDDQALEVVRDLYGRYLQDGMRVLDLMASWDSHLPHGRQFAGVVGLGLNPVELDRNQHLSERVVQDLNRTTDLPFDSASFDAAICTVSVEYLIDPRAVLREIARVLKPDGYLVLTFSNRWFEPKAIRIWRELHEFERMGLVSDYIRQTGGYHDLHTYSVRGLPRPVTDKYYGENPVSDPVFAVWARRKPQP